MSVDILTVPDDPDELLDRFEALFPHGSSALVERRMFDLLLPDEFRRRATWTCIPDDAPPVRAEYDDKVADLCWTCRRAVPWCDVAAGASVRRVVDGRDVRLCSWCTAVRAS